MSNNLKAPEGRCAGCFRSCSECDADPEPCVHCTCPPEEPKAGPYAEARAERESRLEAAYLLNETAHRDVARALAAEKERNMPATSAPPQPSKWKERLVYALRIGAGMGVGALAGLGLRDVIRSMLEGRM